MGPSASAIPAPTTTRETTFNHRPRTRSLLLLSAPSADAFSSSTTCAKRAQTHKKDGQREKRDGRREDQDDRHGDDDRSEYRPDVPEGEAVSPHRINRTTAVDLDQGAGRRHLHDSEAQQGERGRDPTGEEREHTTALAVRVDADSPGTVEKQRLFGNRQPGDRDEDEHD